jgi:UDPglucose--hexose-1-phosphate uridylyltransferase
MSERNEIRQNKVTREWVVYSGARGKRPRDFLSETNEKAPLPSLDANCPFCPGNEHLLRDLVMEVDRRDGKGWQTRVVPNKFPAVVPEGDTERVQKGMYLTMGGYGRHEVVIESPLHNRQVATMSLGEVSTLVDTYHRRYTDLTKEHRNKLVLIFRNHGAKAGTSLVHPHSQIIVVGMVPQHIRWRDMEAQRYFDEWGRCVLCDVVEFEVQDRQRVLLDNPAFLAFVPFAAEVPCEIWIVPKRHQADFSHLGEDEKALFARALHGSLGLLHGKLRDPDYNYIVNSAARSRADEPYLHWYLQIRPRMTTRAGFEIGSGISINPSLPEDDAMLLAGPEKPARLEEEEGRKHADRTHR